MIPSFDVEGKTSKDSLSSGSGVGVAELHKGSKGDTVEGEDLSMVLGTRHPTHRLSALPNEASPAPAPTLHAVLVCPPVCPVPRRDYISAVHIPGQMSADKSSLFSTGLPDLTVALP